MPFPRISTQIQDELWDQVHRTPAKSTQLYSPDSGNVHLDQLGFWETAHLPANDGLGEG